jgi:hypothetical protein
MEEAAAGDAEPVQDHVLRILSTAGSELPSA